MSFQIHKNFVHLRKKKVTVTSLKCSPRSLVRSRRSGHIGPSPVIVSPDPDLLIPIRTSLRRYVDEDEEHLKFSTLVKQESLETSSESTESVGSSISRKYSSLDVPSRRKYIFSDKMPRKISLDEQEDSPSRTEEMDESLMVNTSRKVSREELDIKTLSRKTSIEESEASMDPPRQLTRGETEASFDSRKLPRDLDSTMRYYSFEKMSPVGFGMDSQRQRSLRDRKDHMDSISKVIPKSELDLDTTSGSRYSDALMNPSIKHKENLDFPPNIQRGRIIRENSFDATCDSSMESSKKFKMFGKTDLSKDILSRIMPQDEHDVSTDFERLKKGDIDPASRNIIRDEFERSKSFKENRDSRMEIPSKKLSEQEFVMDAQRIQRKLVGSVETPIGKIQRETLGLSVESPRRKISREEFVVTNPGQFGPPDLTASSLMLWKPASDSLSTLVYDGILEKSYENPLGASSCDLSHATSMSISSQSLLENEGQSENSSLESGGKDKGKMSSKLKNLFKKKKDKEKDKDS